LEADHANLRAALVWLDAAGDRAGVARIAIALGRFWAVHGHYDEGRKWLGRVLGAGEVPDRSLRVSALSSLGYIALLQGDTVAARENLSACVTDRSGGRDALAVASAFVGLAGMAIQQGEYDLGKAYLDDAAAMSAQIPDARLATLAMGRAIANLGNLACEQGDIARAVAHGQESLRRFREAEYVQGVLMSRRNLATLALTQGDLAGAHEHLCEILTHSQSSGDPRLPIEAVEIAALVALEQRRLEQAARWFGSAASLRHRFGLGLFLPPSERAMRERALTALRAGLGASAFIAAWTAGSAAPMDRVIDEVLGVPQPEPVSTGNVQLTKRERDVLRLLVGGLSDRAIGEELFIGERTVQSHLTRLYAKLGVRSRTAAIVAAIVAGLVDPPVGDHEGSSPTPIPQSALLRGRKMP
jgi:non-specific serine/threonine protein kinase